MTLRYVVGIKIGHRADQMPVEAEDALIAALKVKTAQPRAAATCASERPGAINAIGILARSARIRPITPDVRLCPTLSDQDSNHPSPVPRRLQMHHRSQRQRADAVEEARAGRHDECAGAGLAVAEADG